MAALPEEHRTVLMLRELEEMDLSPDFGGDQCADRHGHVEAGALAGGAEAGWLRETEGEPRAVR